ncbi:MAG: M15 family metallopeptidase [Oscillospiraceae bacterium]|nr:M15 family metallopeptidase [Oscillospiraceae bacterium]
MIGLTVCGALLAGCGGDAPAVSGASVPSSALSAPAGTPEPSLAVAPTPEPSAPPESPAPPLPEGFVYLRDVVPDLVIRLAYATPDNFTGAVTDGYRDPEAAVLTRQAADALALVQADLRAQGLGLLIHDAYRPQRGVDCFARWADAPDDPALKAIWYPNEDKTTLFARGYLAHKSGHSRGSTVDLTLIRLADGGALDMGTRLDLLDPLAAHGAPGLTQAQSDNRLRLKQAMEARGFTPYSREWWHYTLTPEPFPDTYFDFIAG